MSSNNLKGSLPSPGENSDNIHIATNSLERTLVVSRLPVWRSAAVGIYECGYDNNYYHTALELGKRSSTYVTVSKKQSEFIHGLGFVGATSLDVMTGKAVPLNEKGLTAFDLSLYMSRSISEINVAIHVDYNILGEAIGFTPIPYEFVRKKVLTIDDVFNKFIVKKFTT